MHTWRYVIKKELRRLESQYTTLNRLEVSRSALLHNVGVFRKNNPGKHIIPVLKSNAYGHGLTEVAQALLGADVPYVAVDGYFEALRVRSVVNQSVLVMGYIHPDNYAHIRTRGLAFVAHDETTVRALGRLGRAVKVHVEVDTGMHRHGVSLVQLESLLKLIKSFPSLELEGVMSHLADADGIDPGYTAQQQRQFENAVGMVSKHGFSPKYVHLAQSAGSTKITSTLCNTIRLGIGLYGINPLAEKDPRFSALESLRPAARLISTVAKINEINPGDRVSYNGIWEASTATRVGVLPLGYYEGIPRALSNVGVVGYKGEYAPIVGRVCMNHTMIDVGKTDVNELDEVIVISNNSSDRNSIAGWQREFGLFAYSSLTGLVADIRRILVK